MTRLTALIIRERGDDVKCLAGGPNKEGNWTGWISLYRDGNYDHDLLSTPPIFATEQDAVRRMQEIVAAVREGGGPQ